MARSEGVPPGHQPGRTGKKVGVFDRPAGRGISGRLIAIIAVAAAIAIAVAVGLNA